MLAGWLVDVAVGLVLGIGLFGGLGVVQVFVELVELGDWFVISKGTEY